jgi:hypothetical protein
MAREVAIDCLSSMSAEVSLIKLILRADTPFMCSLINGRRRKIKNKPKEYF